MIVNHMDSAELYQRMREADPELPIPERVTNVSIDMGPLEPVTLSFRMTMSFEAMQAVIDSMKGEK